MVQVSKKIALLHRYPQDRIKETNAAFPYLQAKGIEVLTFKTFDRLGRWGKFFKDLAWMLYAPALVWRKGYDVIYCDDSFPVYPAFVKFASPRSLLVLRLGDLHLMYHTRGLLYKILHFFELIGWHCADRIICISEPMAKKVSRELSRFREWIGKGGSDPFVVVVRDPVDPNDFNVNGARNHGTVMFHGLLTRNKNIDILLEAARRLPKVNFVVIGDGPDRRRLQGLAPNNVFFKGWVPFKSISRYIATCSVGVALRSDNPGNEYVVTSPFLQYGIMGKPCLVTRRKAFEGYDFQFSTVEEMVERLDYLLKHPEEGKKLREYILEFHSADKIGEQIWSLLSA